jgi:3alpha(or 20beta)-hydroxysteroid dehydrogenase
VTTAAWPALLEGRAALVTGGASGIGRAIAARFAAAGARGVVTDVAPAANVPADWSARLADVRREDEMRAVLADAAAELGGLDTVVVAAGVVPPWRRVGELDLDEWDEVFAINVRGVATTLKHAAELLPPGGTIVAVASLNAWRADGRLMSYSASKHAVLGIVRSAALDLGPRGIRVNAVAPGPVATEALRARMARRTAAGGLDVTAALGAAAQETALGRIATVEDVANAVLFLASDLSAATTGHMIPIDGGLT